MENYLDVLTQTMLFAKIERENLAAMLTCLRPVLKTYKKYATITQAEEEFEHLGIMLQGEATVSKENAAGDRMMIKIMKPGDMFGEMVVFSKHTRWPATVQAREACVVCFLPKDRIVGECERVCPWHKTLIMNMLRIISERALMLNKKVEYLSIKSMRSKICTYLWEHYKMTGKTTFDLPFNRNELADFLNVSRPSMSREMGRLREEEVIDFHLMSIRILDLEALKKQV